MMVFVVHLDIVFLVHYCYDGFVVQIFVFKPRFESSGEQRRGI